MGITDNLLCFIRAKTPGGPQEGGAPELQRADQAPHHLGAWPPRQTPALAGGVARGAQETLPAPHPGQAKKQYQTRPPPLPCGASGPATDLRREPPPRTLPSPPREDELGHAERGLPGHRRPQSAAPRAPGQGPPGEAQGEIGVPSADASTRAPGERRARAAGAANRAPGTAPISY